jgi:ABC-type nitrate/sulfonate/bicarbonate transport system substrate-binding protein
MKIRSLCFFLMLAFLYAIPTAAIAASATQKAVITPASFSDREGMLVVAQQQGFFRKHNVDAQLVLMPNGPLALTALAGGESQFYYGTTSGASLGAVVNGLDGVFVAGFVKRLVGAFGVGRDIKTPADLKGKRIGVASLSGGNWMFTMLALEHKSKQRLERQRVILHTLVRGSLIAQPNSVKLDNAHSVEQRLSTSQRIAVHPAFIRAIAAVFA